MGEIGAASPQLTDYSIEPASNRLSSLSVDGQARARSFDAVGNTTAWTAEAGDFAGSRMSASYGGRNRLQSVSREDAGGPIRIARYAYNPFGERIAKWTGAAAIANTGAPSRQYVYDDAGRLIGEYSGSGELISEHVWLDDTPVAVLKPASSPQGGQAIAASGSAPALRAYFVHPDHLDTPRVIVNAANQTVWRWDSAPYGDTAADENPSALGEFSYSLRLPGQQYDGESGQHYNYFRDYEAATGRYVQSDPIGLWGGPNTFGYADADPLRHLDVYGLAKRPYDFKNSQKEDQYARTQRCYYCGNRTIRSATPHPNRFNADHFKAGAMGGGSAGSNIVTSCQMDNLKKGTMDGDEYIKRHGTWKGFFFRLLNRVRGRGRQK